jgi:TRAP-type transport system small permease protein
MNLKNSFSKAVAFLSKLVNPLSGVFGAAIGCTVLAAMMFLTFFDVIGRYVFNKPIDGTDELIRFMMVTVIGFALGYCALLKGHIRVDLILQYVSKRANQWFDVFTYAISLIFYILFTVQAWLYSLDNISGHLTSAVLAIPISPFVFILFIGAVIVTLIFLRDFLKSIEEVMK